MTTTILEQVQHTLRDHELIIITPLGNHIEVESATIQPAVLPNYCNEFFLKHGVVLFKLELATCFIIEKRTLLICQEYVIDNLIEDLTC